MSCEEPLYILMLSVHGRIRAQEPELGVDPDTGGQVAYVVDLARSLGQSPMVERVDLITRRIEDPTLPDDYRQEVEEIGPKARIVRLPFGPPRYLRKELLWDYLDSLVDGCLHYLRAQRRLPSVIHGHYADAGYVGVHLSRLLGVPLIHTGHSLGRVKRSRLLAAGRKAKAIDRQFHFPNRIAAEEEILAEAALVIASTHQEVDEQYGLYDNRHQARFAVIPPGVDLSRFSPPGRKPAPSPLHAELQRFLQDARRPPILAIARPEERKNLPRLLQAYGEDRELQEHANLILLLGQRDTLAAMDRAAAKVVADILLGIDHYDLYGRVAIPKHHNPDDIPEYYRYTARQRGVFVNPALTEPFGLTLLEAAASGVPVVATEDGGPRDILANCRNGVLVDPLDIGAMQQALREVLGDGQLWRRRARAGLAGVQRFYSWDAHVRQYLRNVRRVRHWLRKSRRRQISVVMQGAPNPLPVARQILITDIDNTLLGDPEGTAALMDWLGACRGEVAFGVATGRNLDGALRVLRQAGVRRPDVLITDVGTEIYYGTTLRMDEGWANHIGHHWWREGVVAALQGLKGLRPQERAAQRPFKVSYYVNPDLAPGMDAIHHRLLQNHLAVNVVYSHGRFLDILPVRASKGHALRHLAFKWGLPLGAFLVAGDSGNDLEMMRGETLGVIVGNHSPEVVHLRGAHRVYFAAGYYAHGILEGIGHYGFGDRKEEE